MPHNYYSLHNFVDHKNVDQIEYIYTTFSRSLSVTLQQIWSLLVTLQQIWSPVGHQLEPSDRQIGICISELILPGRSTLF